MFIHTNTTYSNSMNCTSVGMIRFGFSNIGIEILTRDSSKPGLAKSITQSDRTQLIQTHGNNNMTHRIKSNRVDGLVVSRHTPNGVGGEFDSFPS